jgi:peptidoglycan/xylan/chitin deacetylase (PgdA/CDA1 family)
MGELTKQKIKKTIQDGPNELRRLLSKQYPAFVTSLTPSFSETEVPVFMFHRVEKEILQVQFEYLKQNGYKTLSIDTFLAILKGETDLQSKSILLTFDDGEKSLYEVAYPLLKKYGFQAAAFVIPFFIQNEPDRKRHKGMVSWPELEEMDKSGYVDVQSHSYYHDLIFTGQALMDFYHPGYDHNPLGIDVPWIDEGVDYTNRIKWGSPIYKHASRLAGQLRYLDDKRIRYACIQWVKKNGEEAFFQKSHWRKELGQVYREAVNKYDNHCFETPQERRQAILDDLEKAKLVLENRLNKPIHHLCLPRGEGSDLTTELSKEIGYSSIFWVTKRGRRVNKKGDSPYSIVRVKDDYLLRLPGKGRESLFSVFRKKIYRRAATLDLY